MRVETVSEVKGRGRTHNDLPKPGTHLRRIYDRLRANCGRVTDLRDLASGKHGIGPDLERLMDFYGCDIRRHQNGFYILCGEWIGSHYTDYVAEAIDRAVAEGRAA